MNQHLNQSAALVSDRQQRFHAEASSHRRALRSTEPTTPAQFHTRKVHAPVLTLLRGIVRRESSAAAA